MKEVKLTMYEKYKYEIIKNLIEKKRNKRTATSIKLNCSLRTINRLIIKFNNEGKYGFLHKNRNKRSNNSKHESIKMMIINLYQSEQYNKYIGTTSLATTWLTQIIVPVGSLGL